MSLYVWPPDVLARVGPRHPWKWWRPFCGLLCPGGDDSLLTNCSIVSSTRLRSKPQLSADPIFYARWCFYSQDAFFSYVRRVGDWGPCRVIQMRFGLLHRRGVFGRYGVYPIYRMSENTTSGKGILYFSTAQLSDLSCGFNLDTLMRILSYNGTKTENSVLQEL